MNILSDTLHVTSGIPSIIIFNSLSFSAIFIILAIISENINHLLKNKIGKKVRIKKKLTLSKMKILVWGGKLKARLLLNLLSQPKSLNIKKNKFFRFI